MSKSNCNCTIWVKQEGKGFYILGTTVSDPDTSETMLAMNEEEFARPDIVETVENIKLKALEKGCYIEKFFIVDPGTTKEDKVKILYEFIAEKPILN